MKRYLIGIPLVMALLFATNCKNGGTAAPVEEVDADTIILDADQYVRFETTKGNFTIKLYRETPLHRHNMVRLARKGFYDNQLFFGVQKGYKIQAGDVDSKNAPQGKEIGIDEKDDTIASEVNPWKFYQHITHTRKSHKQEIPSGCQGFTHTASCQGYTHLAEIRRKEKDQQAQRPAQ